MNGKVKKTGAALAAGATLLGGGSVAVDRQIDPYTDAGSHYEVRIEGERVTIDKNEPRVTLERWGGEESLVVKKTGNYGKSDRPFLSKQRKWGNSKESVVVTPLKRDEFSLIPKAEAQTIQETQGEEGFKIDIVLEQKPDTNVFTLELEGWEDLDFFYQPELTAEEIEQGAERPENVIGSYAVYHTEKRNHELVCPESVLGQIKQGLLDPADAVECAGTNYQTGKLYHIYRPLVYDAEGNEVWGQLHYEEGKLSVTVPQEFLDGAVYPVIVDPTFGYTSAGGTQTFLFGSSVTGYAISKYALPDPALLSKLTLYSKGVNSFGTAGFVGVVYNDNSGSPDGLEDTTNTTSFMSGSYAWRDVTFASELALSAGDYWLGFRMFGGGQSLYIAYDTSTGNWMQQDAAGPSYPGAVDPWTGGTSATRRLSIYATYTADAPPDPSPGGQDVLFFE